MKHEPFWKWLLLNVESDLIMYVVTQDYLGSFNI